MLPVTGIGTTEAQIRGSFEEMERYGKRVNGTIIYTCIYSFIYSYT